MRGSLVARHIYDAGERSIPACAGEPCPAGMRRQGRRVYPRVCGGARIFVDWNNDGSGLSPRVRGSPHSRSQPLREVGSIPACAGGAWTGCGSEPRMPRSIPACAGEPDRGGMMGTTIKVYPRVCGGARREEAHGQSILGLSPRVRGSPTAPSHRRPTGGSIPACAGEPWTS